MLVCVCVCVLSESQWCESLKGSGCPTSHSADSSKFFWPQCVFLAWLCVFACMCVCACVSERDKCVDSTFCVCVSLFSDVGVSSPASGLMLTVRTESNKQQLTYWWGGSDWVKTRKCQRSRVPTHHSVCLLPQGCRKGNSVHPSTGLSATESKEENRQVSLGFGSVRLIKTQLGSTNVVFRNKKSH